LLGQISRVSLGIVLLKRIPDLLRILAEGSNAPLTARPSCSAADIPDRRAAPLSKPTARHMTGNFGIRETSSPR
jgi:hypothetical protein